MTSQAHAVKLEGSETQKHMDENCMVDEKMVVSSMGQRIYGITVCMIVSPASQEKER